MICSLCSGPTEEFNKGGDKSRYVQCQNCKSVMLLPELYVSSQDEKNRYLEHHNDVSDQGYQNFVSPITSRVQDDFSILAMGLDYGCGTGPVATAELKKRGYRILLFDPYFEDHPESLQGFYDFIICCEVMEHFHKPCEEFEKLYSLLMPGGKLYCKTSLFSGSIDFKKWYYKDDPTHVFFYSAESLEWIREYLGFKKLEIFPKLIVFEK